MNALEILPFILFVVIIVTTLSERINLPYPLLLVIAGLVVGFLPGIPNWHPPTDIILALFLPPILFASARTLAWQEVKNNASAIGWLSIALVFITAIAIAFALDYFIPHMTFSTALVLGAIISPTDTVAANAILSRLNVQQSIIRTIEVESLFNDATGIVLYKAAVLFVALGTISLYEITFRTLLVGLGGIGIGLVFSYLTSLITEQFLAESENELPIIMSLILAYVAYLFAERIGVSGVLAVVAAGLYHQKTEQSIEARTRLAEKSVWDTLIFFLNGIIFLTIGIQFPSYLHKVSNYPLSDLIIFPLLTIALLLILRFVWVSIVVYGTHWWHKKRHKKDVLPSFPYARAVIMSWSGMRGLVPLALGLAIPTMIANNVAFPKRDLIIYIVIITILFTLLVQGLTLPFLIKKMKAGKDDQAEREKTTHIYRTLTQRAIKNMNEIISADEQYGPNAKKLVREYYNNRMLHVEQNFASDAASSEVIKEASHLLTDILHFERRILTKLRASEEISDEIYLRILRKLDRDEVGFACYH